MPLCKQPGKDKQGNKEDRMSPEWNVLEQPIPIGTVVPNATNVVHETIEENKDGNEATGSSAMYVTSHSNETDDVMDQVANEFQRVVAKSRRSDNANDGKSNEDNGDSGQNRITDQGYTNGSLEHGIAEEETEVWTTDEEKSELTEELAILRNDPSYSTIEEQSETPIRENTESSNTVTISSDGGSNVEMQVTKNVTGPSKSADQSNTSGINASKTRVNEGVRNNPTTVTSQTRRPVPSTSVNPTLNTGSRTQNNTSTDASSVTAGSNGALAGNQSGGGNNRQNTVPQSMANFPDGRPPDGRHPVNRPRWNFSTSGSQSARVHNPVQVDAVPESNGVQHKPLLEIMSLGLGNFTNDMATIVIDKLRPEYDDIAKRVGQAVKEETSVELNDLRQKVDAAEKLLNHLDREKNKLHDELLKEKEHMRKEIEKEKMKRMKDNEEKDEKIDKLEKELKKAVMLNREKDRMSRRADSKAKTEEHRRIQAEESCGIKVQELNKEISKLKSEVLVQKSKNRVVSANAREVVKSGSMARKLKSYHETAKGKWPKTHPKNVPYDEGDP